MSRYADLILYKTYADLRAEASRGYLGVLWWIIEPVLYMAVFYVIFGLLLQRGGEGFVAFLLCGLVVWKWFDSTVRHGALAIQNGVGLMRQVYVPKFMFPATVVLANTAKFLVVFLLFMAFLILYGISPSWLWLALPLVVLIQFMLVAAFASLAAAIVPFIPDFKLLIDNGLTLLFFLSGIFFDVSTLPASVQPYFYLNPMVTIIDAYRDILLAGSWPNVGALASVGFVSVIVLACAYWVMQRYDRSYPKIII